jgi:hypothetical protein
MSDVFGSLSDRSRAGRLTEPVEDDSVKALLKAILTDIRTIKSKK